MTNKHVVSISLGSSRRDKKSQITLGDQTIVLERIGCDGDEAEARRLFTEMDGQVDAFGVGGVELNVRLGQRYYPLRSGQSLVRNVRHTPCLDGAGLKIVLESTLFQQAAPHLPPISPRRAMMPLAVDRFGMALSLHRAGFELVFCDLLFALGWPIPIKGLSRLQWVAALLLPIFGKLPVSMVYPTGENQDENTPRYEKWFNYGPVIAGDFQYIRRYMPLDLSNKIIMTNTTTAEDVSLLQSRNLAWLVTSTPRLDGRSFGTNMLEAALTAYAGKNRPLSDSELLLLLAELDLKPTVQQLNGMA